MIFYEMEKEFKLNLKNNIKELNNSKKVKVFTFIISSGIYKTYTSPVREDTKIITTGVVSSKIDFLKLLNLSEFKLIDYFFVDIKIKNNSNHNKKLLNFFQNQKNFFYFNPTDLTVESVLQYLSVKNDYNLNNILILGTGNIGSKLSIKLYEFGHNIYFTKRNKRLGKILESFIDQNFIKNHNTVKLINIKKNNIEKFDCIILCATKKNLLSSLNFNLFKGTKLIIEVGKNNLSKTLIKKLHEQNMEILRLSITNNLLGFLNTFICYIKNEMPKIGRKKYKNSFIISGGFYGLYGDIVVDNFNNPKKVWGVADGHGKFIKSINNKKLEKKLLK